MKKHTEARLEDAIVDSLTQQGGYLLHKVYGALRSAKNDGLAPGL